MEKNQHIEWNMVIHQAVLQCHTACSILPWLISPENKNIFPKKGTSLCRANTISPWCGIKRKVNEHETVLGNILQTSVRGRRAEVIFEGEVSFSCVASLHDLHLWDKRDFQVTVQNNTVNVKYVNALKLTAGWKETFSVTRLPCWHTTQFSFNTLVKKSEVHPIKICLSYMF